MNLAFSFQLLAFSGAFSCRSLEAGSPFWPLDFGGQGQ